MFCQSEFCCVFSSSLIISRSKLILMKAFFFGLCIFFSLILGYGVFNSWWMFIPSTLLILGLTYFFYRESWKKYLGIDFEWSELAGAATLCLVFFFTARFMIQWALPKEYALDLLKAGNFLTIITNLFNLLMKKWF